MAPQRRAELGTLFISVSNLPVVARYPKVVHTQLSETNQCIS